jgi:hypothetical protein
MPPLSTDARESKRRARRRVPNSDGAAGSAAIRLAEQWPIEVAKPSERGNPASGAAAVLAEKLG